MENLDEQTSSAVATASSFSTADGSATSNSCNFRVHQFTDILLNTNVFFHVLKLKDSFFLWIGLKPELSQLAVAMAKAKNERADHSAFVSTTLLGNFSDMTSQNLATRLSKRTGKQVFVSCNIPDAESMLISLVEKRLSEEMEKYPDNF